jgi:hypothetical protein
MGWTREAIAYQPFDSMSVSYAVGLEYDTYKGVDYFLLLCSLSS